MIISCVTRSPPSHSLKCHIHTFPGHFQGQGSHCCARAVPEPGSDCEPSVGTAEIPAAVCSGLCVPSAGSARIPKGAFILGAAPGAAGMTVPGGTGTSAPLQDGESRAGIPASQTRQLPSATLTQCPDPFADSLPVSRCWVCCGRGQCPAGRFQLRFPPCLRIPQVPKLKSLRLFHFLSPATTPFPEIPPCPCPREATGCHSTWTA